MLSGPRILHYVLLLNRLREALAHFEDSRAKPGIVSKLGVVELQRQFISRWEFIRRVAPEYSLVDMC